MKKILLSLLCLLAAVSSYAAKTAKAVVSTDKKTLTFYYDEKDHSSEGTVCALNEGENKPGWYDYMGTVTTAVFDASFKDARPTTTYSWFRYQELDHETYEFINSALSEIRNIENLNTSEVTNMGYMFYGCTALESLNLSSFNTAKVENMSDMFSYCEALKSLDLSSFNTAKVTDMGGMFGCLCAMESLDLSSFNTANVENMSDMFIMSSKLKTINLSSFNTGKVTGMNSMFASCENLESLDLSSFNTANVTGMGDMFSGCNALTAIYASENFVTTKVEYSTNMFGICTSLVGGAGTKYSEEHTDAAYAKIDGGTGNPGYFTDKAATAISGIKADGNAPKAIYNLAGKKVDGNYKGIVIINGKKVMKN